MEHLLNIKYEQTDVTFPFLTREFATIIRIIEMSVTKQ